MRTTLFLAALAALAAAPAFAQQPNGGERFTAADTNKDGALSAAEWTAMGRKPEGFQRIDTNKDGKLTPAELQAARAASGGGKAGGGGGGPGKFFAATDSNSDGALSKVEWDASGRNPQGFQMMDADKDGKVTRAEADAAMAMMMQSRAK